MTWASTSLAIFHGLTINLSLFLRPTILSISSAVLFHLTILYILNLFYTHRWSELVLLTSARCGVLTYLRIFKLLRAFRGVPLSSFWMIITLTTKTDLLYVPQTASFIPLARTCGYHFPHQLPKISSRTFWYLWIYNSLYPLLPYHLLTPNWSVYFHSLPIIISTLFILTKLLNCGMPCLKWT